MNSSLIWFFVLPVAGFLLLGARGNSRQALWVALALGAFETGYSLAVAGLDYLTLMSFLILAISIFISMRSDDDFYFKIGGAAGNIAMSVAMLIAWHFFHKAMLLDAAEKYMGIDKLVAINPEVDKAQLTEFLRVMSLQLPVWLILHGVLTIHAAARWSRWAWGVVYVPGMIAALIMAGISAGITALQAP